MLFLVPPFCNYYICNNLSYFTDLRNYFGPSPNKKNKTDEEKKEAVLGATIMTDENGAGAQKVILYGEKQETECLGIQLAEQATKQVEQ